MLQKVIEASPANPTRLNVPAWTPPLSASTKINVDATLGKPDGKGAVVVVVRSNLGKFLGA